VLALTLAFLVVAVVAGIVTGSLALLADAGHMLTDVAGLVLALLAMKLAERPASPRRTFGYHRAEVLAALTNGLLLLGVAGYILFEASERFRDPRPVPSGTVLLVAGVGLLVNLAGALLLRAGAGTSLNLRGAYNEVVADALSSVGVIVGALVLVGLPELLREFAEYRLLVYGAVLVFMMLKRPEGLVPEARRKLELHEAEGTVAE